MGAHLANMAPGGVGPLLVKGACEVTPPAANREPPALIVRSLKTTLLEMPAVYSETGALCPGWIAEVARMMAVSPSEFYKLLKIEAAAGEFAAEWAGMQQLSQEKSKPRPSPADKP